MSHPASTSRVRLLAPLALVSTLACGTTAGLAGEPTHTAAAPPALELVETAPVETTLEHADIPDAWRVWVEMIDGAQTQLDIAQFYITSVPGERMEPVLDAIVRAAGRGVAVRILVDAKFGRQYPETLASLGAVPNVTVVIWDLSATLGGVLHAKYFVVDRREAYFGSQNFDWRSLAHILELGLRVRVPEVVGAIAEVFDADWAIATGARSDARRPEGAPVPAFPVTVSYAGAPAELTLALSPKGWLPDESDWDLPRLVALIDAAKTRVRVQLLSYETTHRDDPPFTELDDALRRAAGRGVAVELLASNWNLRGDRLAALSSLASVPGIEVRFVTIPEASTGFIPFARTIHAKLMTVDGTHGWVGTSNWGHGYFYGSRNIGLIVASARFTDHLDRFFGDTWSSPYAETLVPGRAYPEPRVGK